MKTFLEFLENKDVDHNTKHNFLQAVGETRQALTAAYKVLNRNETPESLYKYMEELCQIINSKLKPYDRKPVFGNNIEFRMINTGLGSFSSANNQVPDWIKQSISSGNKKELLQKVEAAEKELMEFYKKISNDHGNESFIDLHKQVNKNFG